MNPNTRSVLSSWFSGEERSSAQSMPSQEAPDYIYAPMHHKMEKRGAGRGRGAPHGARAPRSAGPSPIRPSQPGRGPNAGSYHQATTTEDYGVDGRAVPRGRQLRGSKEGGFSEHGALPTDVHKANARSHNAEPFDYHQVSPAVEKSWRAPRSHPSSAPTTPHKSRPPLKQRRSRFKEYLSSEDIEKGLKDGTLLEGVLRVNHKRMRLAYVSVEGFDKDVLIDGIYARNRAFEGDTVVIRLNDPSEWEVIKEDKDEDEDAVTDKEEDDDEEEEEEDDEDEAADAVLKPAPLKLVDDSLVDAMSDTDDDLAELNVDVVSQAGTGESTVVKYKEAIDAEEAVSSRGWWPSPATPVEAAVVPPAVEVPVAVPIDVAENRQAGKRCWRCQEVGHIARDCTNAEKPAAKTPIKAASTKTPAKQQQQGETKEPLGEGETAGKLRRTAKVVAIAKSSHIEEMVGYLKPCGLAEEEIGKGNFYAFFVPLEKRMPRILVPVKRLSGSLISHPDELTTNLFVCKLTGWPSSSSHPRGELVKNMGPSGDMEVELRVLLQDNNIDWEDSFTPDVLACLPVVPAPPARWAIPNEEVAARRDLRRERIFTIDPATAKDMDDAVSCKPLPDGSYLVGVHIADVTYFVKPDTPLDLDARKRATTVYMVHRSIPMLPRLLSDNMCSLVPGEDRLSFSVTWRMDKEGRVLEEPWFGRTIIRSCVKMSYEAAQQMLDGTFTEPSTEPAGDAATAPAPTKRGVVFAKDSTAPEHRVEQIVEDVRVLNGMAEALRRRRFEDGSLTLDDAKMYFCLDEMQMPTDVGTYVRTASHFLIEELMLLANKSVALRIHQAYPDRALLRRHPPPNDNKLAEFVTMCKANSIEFDTSCSKGFQRSLDQLKHLPNPDIAAVVTRLAMKPMSVAKYVCTDEEATDGTYHHYALAFDHYTHFTSPIRRYADVIVHRLLDACLQAQPAPLDKDDLCSICDNCNMRKNKADKAQDKCDLVFLCTLLKNHPPKDLEATVITVNSRSFEVYVPLYGVEKLAHADDMPLAKLDHDKKNQTLFLHWRAAAAASSDAVDAAADGDADNAPAEVTDDDADKAGDQKQSAKPQKKDKRRMQKKQAKFEGKTVVQEIKPFTRLRVRLYPDLQRRPIDVRLVVVPPEGVAVPDTYYNAPESVSRAATPAKQAHGRKQQHQPPTPTHRQQQHQPHQPARHQPHPQVLHVEDDEESAIEDWVKSVREDDARQKQQIWDRIALFLNDPTQSKLHLPAELTAFERRLAHEIAEDHGLHHHSANFFCPETGAKERRLTLFKQAPQASAGGRSHSRSVPGPAALDAAGVADGADGVPVKTPTRGKRPPKPKSAVRAHPMPQHLAGEGVPLPADGADHQAAAAPHKKKVARGTRTKAKERAEAVKGQLEAAGIDLPDEGAAPAEVRTRVHRPKRAPKPRAVKPAAVQPPVEQQHPVVHDVPQQVEA